ncbi:MAG TPA: DUF1330 domain-containing protein [Noviherbaspirillum sp.]|uniref:DUF1330 domain-containing protein n=1 Tax=Noviherbaspirillum sp. TaxID=1926288 RepID=UPI002D2D70BD|nr:DUF1330 domain-containing protein [Noviherbaspirillum sp.]HYD96033.1 DUF1330 domain-containing protein [Noviherbaspirillum sp.]
MKYYSVAELDITDRSWVADYAKNVTPMVERYGGRYLARTPKVEKVEGSRKAPQVFLIIEWPSKEAAAAFYESEAYRPWREARSAGSHGEFALVAGEDVSGLARIG